MNTVPSRHEEVSPAATVQSADTTGTKIAAKPSFTSAEREEFRCEDRQATAAVVGILITCFTLGLFIYLTVLFSCLWAD